MAKTITTVNTTDTFQTWLNKTNEMVGIFAGDAMTASGSGDTATGNSTLVGDFTATNLIGTTKLTTASIGHTGAGSTIAFTEPVNLTGPDQVVATFQQAGGAQTQYTTGTLSWDIGIKDTGGDFIMNTGGGDEELVLTTAGTLTIPNLIVSEDIVATQDVTANNGIFNNVTINGSLGGLTTADVAEDPSATYDSGTQYFTRARVASSLSQGSNITISEIGNGVQEISANISLSGYAQEQTGVTFTSLTLVDTPATGGFDPSGLGARILQGTEASGALAESTIVFQTGHGSPASSFADRLVIYNSQSVFENSVRVKGNNGLRVDQRIIAGSSGDSTEILCYGDVDCYNGTDVTIRLDGSEGDIIAEGDVTAFGTVSDINLKENIEVIPDALDKVSQLRGITFNYKDDPDYRTTGLIAQEVEKVLPGVVYEASHIDEDAEPYKALRYGNVVGLLVEAIKELQDRIVELEKRCDCNG